MARPLKPGIGSYLMDVDFLHNRKIRRIKQACDSRGIECLIYLLGNIYQKHGYYMRWNDDLLFDMADSVGLSDGAARDLIKKTLQVGFFDKAVFDRLGILTSGEILSRFLLATQKRKTVPIRRDIYDLLGEKPDLYPNVELTADRIIDPGNGVIDTQNAVCGVDNPRSEVKRSNKNAADAASARVREAAAAAAPEQPEVSHLGQQAPPTALPAYAETMISDECLERYRAYCEAWNTLGTPVRASPWIPHYADCFVRAEHQTQDTALFSKVIAHLRANATTTIHTGKVRIAPDTIFTATFAEKVLSGYYDIDYEKRKNAAKPDRRKLPARDDY